MTVNLQGASLQEPQTTVSTSTGAPPRNPNQPVPLYTDTVPGAMFNPLGSPGNDVLSATYLWLDWLELNPENSNGAQVFLLYLSNFCAQGNAGMYDEEAFNNLATTIVSIQNGAGKSLVAESVDIMMMQLYLTNGGDAQAAYNEIYALFPPTQTDPISVAARTEADSELKVMNSYSSAPGSKNPPPTQASIQKEWYDYMTDPTTVGSINGAKSAILSGEIQGCGDNVFLALMVLLLLLEKAGINAMDAYGTLSKQLADESAQLNSLITRWDGGIKNGDDAQTWMNDLQSLQNDMDETPFDATTQASIDKQFDTIKNQPAVTPSYVGYVDSKGNPVNASGQAVDANGYPLYEVENSKNDNSQTAYYKDGKYYIEGSNPPREVDSDKKTTYQPLYWTDNSSAKGGLTDKSGSTVSGRQNPTSTVPGVTGVEYSNNLYIDPNNHFLYTVSATGEAPPGATVYTANSNDQFQGMQYYNDNNGNAVFLEPPPGTTKLTLGDQAYNGDSYTYINLTFNATGTSRSWKSNGRGTDENLYTTIQLYQPEKINPNSPSSGGFSSEEGAIDSSLNALINPLSQQTSAVGAEMQQKSSDIELYDNTFSSVLLKNLPNTYDAIQGNLKV